MLKVTLPDGSVREYSDSVTPLEVAQQIGPGLAKAAIAAEIDGRVIGLDEPLPGSGSVSLNLLTKKDPKSLDVMRHSWFVRRCPAGLWSDGHWRVLLRL
jgi:threonyl-tRNA synthetase